MSQQEEVGRLDIVLHTKYGESVADRSRKGLVSLEGMLGTLWDNVSVPGDVHVIYQTEAAARKRSLCVMSEVSFIMH